MDKQKVKLGLLLLRQLVGVIVNKFDYLYVKYNSWLTVMKLFYHLNNFSVFFKLLKKFALLVRQPYSFFIMFASFNLVKFMYYCAASPLFLTFSSLFWSTLFSCYSPLMNSKSCFFICSFIFLKLMFISGIFSKFWN